MAARQKFAPTCGAYTAKHVIARLESVAAVALSQEAIGRPVLGCRWEQDTSGRLFCYWQAQAPTAISVPDFPGMPGPCRPASITLGAGQ